MATKLSDRLAELEAAFRAERDARERLREAMHTQGEILRDLRASGVVSSIIAVRVARILGQPLGVESRKRIAAMLRSRTRRHSFLPRPPGVPELGPVAFPKTEAEAMPRLIKRIVTEEQFIQTDDELVEDSSKLDEESDDETDEAGEGESDDDEERSDPAGRRRPRSDRRPR